MRYDNGHNSIKFIIFSNFILQILSLNFFHKKLLNLCYANCSRTVSNFAMPSRLLAAPTVLNQISLFAIFQKNFRFCFITKKDFPYKFFVEYFYKNICNLRMRISYQNCELLNFCVCKISCQYHQYHEIYATWSSPKLKRFLQKLST